MKAPVQVPRVLTLQYRRALEPLESVFNAAAGAVPDHPCRPGCSACCYGPFDVSPAAIWNLLDGLSGLDGTTRARALRRVRDVAEAERNAAQTSTTLTLDALGEDTFDDLCDALANVPCPMLEDGVCVVHPYRPQACIMTGAVWASATEAIDLACPIGLTDGFAHLNVRVGELQEAVARVEKRAELPIVGRARTTIAGGLDAVLRTGLVRRGSES